MGRCVAEARARRTKARHALGSFSMIIALPMGWATCALAQDEPRQAAKQSPSAVDEDQSIVVIGNRAIIATLSDVPVEQTYDEDSVASYDASTVGEVLDQIRNENGDTDPSILVNGRPVSDLNDVSDLPVEAIQRIESLPRGAASRVNGAAGQRAYNVVLRSSVKSATLTASREVATEGGWGNNRGEALFTYIKGQDRLNLTLRAARSGILLETERNYVPRAETTPYSALGNIIPFSGPEIDPTLSTILGHAVSVLAVPSTLASPTLVDLTSGADRTNPSNQSLYRGLRGASRPYEAALTGSKTLATWLSLSLNGRLTWGTTESLSGLPSARFLIPATNQFTPFSVPTYIALNDPSRPLHSNSEISTQSLSSTLNAMWSTWRAALTGRWDRREQTYLSQFTGALTNGSGIIGNSVNPFDGKLAATIPVSTRESRSRSTTTQIGAELEGQAFSIWAGPINMRGALGAVWVDYSAADRSGPRLFRRHEYSAKAGATIPVTSTQSDFLPQLGDSEVELDFGRSDLGRYGKLNHHSIAFNWQIVPWLRLVGSHVRDERSIQPELLAAPEILTPNVPYFDPVTGQTVDVTIIYGGAGNLLNEDLRTRTLSLAFSPARKINLQINIDYILSDLRNQFGALPPSSSAVVTAFPDRFQRDSSGTLVLVDARTVNFARQGAKKLRFGLRFALPLTKSLSAATGSTGVRRRVQPARLQVNATHSVLLENTTIIRPGLPEVDLLDGGAIGIGGGLQRHVTNAAFTIAQGASGLRVDVSRRGKSQLVTGTLASPDMLTFAPLTTIDLRAYADLGQLLPLAKFAEGTRVSVIFDNLANQRQRVRTLAGDTPHAYQPVRRDPIGRTVRLELRKVF